MKIKIRYAVGFKAPGFSNFCNQDAEFVREPLIFKFDSFLRNYHLKLIFLGKHGIYRKIVFIFYYYNVGPISNKYINWWMKKNNYVWSEEFYDIYKMCPPHNTVEIDDSYFYKFLNEEME